MEIDDEDPGFLVPDSHNPLNTYCQKCGQTDHQYQDISICRQKRALRSNSERREFYAPQQSFEIKSYSGNSASRQAKKNRNLRKAEELERQMKEDQERKEMSDKIKKNLIIKTERLVKGLPIQQGEPETQKSLDLAHNSSQTRQVTFKKSQEVHAQITSTSKQVKDPTSIWNTVRKPTHEMSLENRMSLQFWK